MGSLGHRVVALVLAFAGLAALAGCTQGHAATAIAQAGTVSENSAQSPSRPEVLPAMTHVQHASLASITSGHLVLSGGCFYLATHNAEWISLVWPYQFSAGTGPVGVYDANDKLVARPGEELTLGGGPEILAHVAPGTITNTHCLAGAAEAWFVGGVGV